MHTTTRHARWCQIAKHRDSWTQTTCTVPDSSLHGARHVNKKNINTAGKSCLVAIVHLKPQKQMMMKNVFSYTISKALNSVHHLCFGCSTVWMAK